jgi:predicted translin family RNA/ssDNA-binding protein
MGLEIKSFILTLILYSFLQGLILSNALRAQKNAEDERCTTALSNLRSEVIGLRNEAMEKGKTLLSLVDKAKVEETRFNTQSEAYKAEVEDLREKLAKANEDCALAKAGQEISEYWKTKLEKKCSGAS